MNKDYFRIETSFANYTVEIWHQYPSLDKVYIGATKKCVSFSVYLDANGKGDRDEHPQLDGFGFNEHCNLTGNHVKGIGSVHLLNTAMRFVTSYYKFPHDIKFQFTDSSFIECISYHMPLSMYYTTFYGKTWYEIKFGAVPLIVDLGKLEKQRKELRTFLEGKPDIAHLFLDSKKQVALRNKVLSIYEKCNTLMECLEILKKEDCNVFEVWLEKIYLEHVSNMYGAHWIIKNTLPRIAITYKKLAKMPPDTFILKGGFIFKRHDIG